MPIEPYFVDVPMRKSGSNEMEVRQFPVFLPHEVVHHIFSASTCKQFMERFGASPNVLGKFWEESRKMPWYGEHPWAREIEANPTACIPIRVHADDAPMSKRTGIFVANMSPCTPRLQTWLTRLLLFCFPTVLAIEPHSYHPLFEVIAWSLKFLSPACNHLFPHCDHERRPWPLRSQRARWSEEGAVICGGWSFVFVQLCGDWKFFKDTMALKSHYGGDEFCWRCCACKSSGPLCAWDVSTHAPWTMAPRSNIDFLAHLATQGVGLQHLPGMHVAMLMCDLMHICFLGFSNCSRVEFCSNSAKKRIGHGCPQALGRLV